MNHYQSLIKGSIPDKIFRLRNVNIMLDYDLAELYEEETITEKEHENLKSQLATSSWDRMKNWNAIGLISV